MPYIPDEANCKSGSDCPEHYFGLTLCSARNVIECSFGHLKARFGSLKRAMGVKMDDLPFVIYACFVLHNYCEVNKETIGKDRVRVSMDYDRHFQPTTAANR